MKKVGKALLKFLQILLITPLALIGGIIMGLFVPFLILAEAISDILYN